MMHPRPRLVCSQGYSAIQQPCLCSVCFCVLIVNNDAHVHAPLIGLQEHFTQVVVSEHVHGQPDPSTSSPNFGAQPCHVSATSVREKQNLWCLLPPSPARFRKAPYEHEGDGQPSNGANQVYKLACWQETSMLWKPINEGCSLCLQFGRCSPGH